MVTESPDQRINDGWYHEAHHPHYPFRSHISCPSLTEFRWDYPSKGYYPGSVDQPNGGTGGGDDVGELRVICPLKGGSNSRVDQIGISPQFGVGGGTFGLKVGVLLQFPIRSLINHGMVNVDMVLEVIERGFGVFWKGLLRGGVDFVDFQMMMTKCRC